MDPAHPGMLDFYRAHLADAPERWVTLLTDAQRVATTDEQKLQLAIGYWQEREAFESKVVAVLVESDLNAPAASLELGARRLQLVLHVVDRLLRARERHLRLGQLLERSRASSMRRPPPPAANDGSDSTESPPAEDGLTARLADEP